MSCSASQERQASAVSSIRAATSSGAVACAARGARPAPSASRSRACSPSADREASRASSRPRPRLERRRGRRCGWVRRRSGRRRPPGGTAGWTSPYSGRGSQLHDELDLPVDALDRAQQLVRSVEAKVVPALAGGEGHAHRVSRTVPLVGGEGRLEDQRAWEVAALARVRAAGRIDQCPASGSRIRAKIAGLS